MSLKSDYRKVLHVGPGGLSCACCNPYNCHPRNMKHLVRRKKRRADKQAVREMAKEQYAY